MRVRAQDANGDMTFGYGGANFLVNSPEAVAQLCVTSLKLWRGEWYLDLTAGMPWGADVLGFGTAALYDNAVKNVIFGVQGVTGITAYSSSLNPTTRELSIEVTISTAFGEASFSVSLYAPSLAGGYGVGGYAQNPYGV